MEYPKIQISLPITREFIRAHREYCFLFSNRYGNISDIGQQASICKGEINTIYIPVRWNLCKSSGWFDDSKTCTNIVKNAMEGIGSVSQVKPLIPFPKIGRGQWANLQEHAPKLLAYIEEEIKKIAYPNIEYVFQSTT